MRAFRLAAPIILLFPEHFLWEIFGSASGLYLHIDPGVLALVTILSVVVLGCGYWAYRHERSLRRRLLEQDELIRRQAEALERLEKAQDGVFADLAHELRTPLTLVLGPLSSLQRHARLTTAEQNLVKMAIENANRLLRCINQMQGQGQPAHRQEHSSPDLLAVQGNGQPGGIFIVEDDAGLQTYLERLLSARYPVYSARNGRQALEMMQSGTVRPQLLITDLMMPGMDGFSLITALRDLPGWANLSVMVLTASSGENDLLRALRLGVDDYVIKPFTEDELLAGVETLMARSRIREETGLQHEDAGSHEWLVHLQEVVGRRLHEFDLKAEDIAQELQMSRTQFFRQIKKDTGLTPAQYLEEARFQRARRLLEDGLAESVKAVAFDVGFKQVKYFSRLFKERFGKTPSEFLGK